MRWIFEAYGWVPSVVVKRRGGSGCERSCSSSGCGGERVVTSGNEHSLLSAQPQIGREL